MTAGGEAAPLQQMALRQAFGLFPSGVAAVCALLDGEPTGLAASSFTSVSLDPPLVSICVAHTSTTWLKLRLSRRLGVSVLAEEHGEVARALSAKDSTHRFATVRWKATQTGAVLVHGSALWLECAVEQQIVAGDHDIVVLRIASVTAHPDVAPIVFHGSQFKALAAS